MIRRIVVTVIFLVLLSASVSTGQGLNWIIGVQAKYGFTNFKHETLGRYIDKINQDLESKGGKKVIEKLTAGNMFDAAIFVRPHRYFALSAGFMPEFRAEKSYTVSIPDAGDFKLTLRSKAVPYYIGSNLYVIGHGYMVEPFFSLGYGKLQDIEFYYKSIDQGKIEEQTNSIDKSYFISLGVGFDYRWKKFLVITSNAGYHFSKTDDLKNTDGDLVNIEGIGKLDLDFSGSFMNIGVRIVF